MYVYDDAEEAAAAAWCGLLLIHMTRLGSNVPFCWPPRRRRLTSCDVVPPGRRPPRCPWRPRRRLSRRHWWQTICRRSTRASGRLSCSASSTTVVGSSSSSGRPRRTRDVICASGYLHRRGVRVVYYKVQQSSKKVQEIMKFAKVRKVRMANLTSSARILVC